MLNRSMETKHCPKCSTTKPIEDFGSSRKRNRPNSWCKRCSADARMRSYYENYESVKEYRKQRRVEKRELIAELKTPCVVCGEAEKCCLDFHHLDGEDKEFEVGFARHYSIERVKAEIAKCVSVCANCHRKIHAGVVSLRA